MTLLKYGFMDYVEYLKFWRQLRETLATDFGINSGNIFRNSF